MAPSESGIGTLTREMRRTARRSPGAPTWFSRIASGFAFVTIIAANSAAAPNASTALDLDRYRGQVVIVDFWASWCKPCRQSIPWLNELRARYGARGLVVIGVNVDAVRADAERFQRDVPIDFEIVYDPHGDLAKAFKVQGMPSTFLLDRRGNIIETHLGFRAAKKRERENAVENLLSRSAE